MTCGKRDHPAIGRYGTRFTDLNSRSRTRELGVAVAQWTQK
jgi:hypothetical protein